MLNDVNTQVLAIIDNKRNTSASSPRAKRRSGRSYRGLPFPGSEPASPEANGNGALPGEDEGSAKLHLRRTGIEQIHANGVLYGVQGDGEYASEDQVEGLGLRPKAE